MTPASLAALPAYYQRYIRYSEGLSVHAALHKSLEALTEKLEEKLNAIGEEVYAPGKWTVAVMLQHIIDAERVMSYRAMCFARNEKTPLPGFDEDHYAAATFDTPRAFDVLLEELKLVRVSNIYLFDSFNESQLAREGVANNVTISVEALGYIIAGHQAHHLRIIEERYVPVARGIILPS